MANSNIKINDLAKTVTKELTNFSQDVADEFKKTSKEVGKEAAKKIKETAPTGGRKKYKKGWTSKVVFESNDDVRINVYNKSDYSLTHLLEHGHQLKSGGRTVGKAAAQPHIAPVEEWAAKMLETKVSVAIKQK